MSAATSDHFTIGGVLGTGFRIWFKNLLPFLIISALIYAPLVIWGIARAQGDLAAAPPDDTAVWIELALELLANIFVAGALTYGIVMELQGQRASLGACIATGVARFGAVLGVAVLASLAFVVGLLALVVPGIIVYCVLYVATPAAVIERTGVRGAAASTSRAASGCGSSACSPC